MSAFAERTARATGPVADARVPARRDPVPRLRRLLVPGNQMIQRALLAGRTAGRDGEEKEPEAASTISGCDTDRSKTIKDGIRGAKTLAGVALTALGRAFMLTHDDKAFRDNFGSVSGDRQKTIITRYTHAKDTLDGKIIACSKCKKKKKGVHLCAEGIVSGSKIWICPPFGNKACPPSATMLHEAAHNAGAPDDILPRSSGYPPAKSEDNAFSYEQFAVDVLKGPPEVELKRRPMGGAQPSLKVGRTDDPLEREADRVAETILGSRVATPAFRAIGATVQLCPGGCGSTPCDHRDEPEVQRSAVPGGAPPGPVASDQAVPGAGAPLSGHVRAFFEPRLGTDLRDVRVHTGAQAAQNADTLHARAYTVGRDVVFGAGQYAPGSEGGTRLLAHELAHVVQQTGSTSAEAHAAPTRIQRQPDVRFPTLEIAAVRSQGAFALSTTSLTSGERADAERIFGSSIDLSRVRLALTPLISAPVTLGNTIRVPTGYSMTRPVLIHELTHVWQFQTKGSGYISDSVFHQTAAWLTRGDRGAAYGYTIVPGKSFHAYTAEQQASIVEDYHRYPFLQGDPEYGRLIAQVRAASPMAAPMTISEEMAAGLPPPQWAVPPSPGQPSGGAFIPLVEVRFRGL